MHSNSIVGHFAPSDDNRDGDNMKDKTGGLKSTNRECRLS